MGNRIEHIFELIKYDADQPPGGGQIALAPP
jgi:hypothetical protein